MSLTSTTYLIFLLICVCAFYLLPKKAKELSLFAFSVAFYCYAMPEQLLIMMVYLWIIYFTGLILHKAARFRKGILLFGLLLSVGFLFFYKYLNFTLSLVGRQEKMLSLIVPIGISYITFQCIAYVVEIYKRKLIPVDSPVTFFTYMLLFMKVTAGPIEPPKRFFESTYKKSSFKWRNMWNALILISTGFVKKMVVADSLAPGVAMVFEAPGEQDGWSVLLAVFMYTLQIYFDFSGYTDIARGSAWLFGIDLTENFKHPYLAKSVREFWRKWHISLSDWLKEYVYFSLGGSRVGTMRRYLNVILVFLVSGLWHGASVTFVIWGLLHGLYQVLEMLTEPILVKARSVLRIKEQGVIHSFFARIRTFVMVMFAWIFFRASSLENAFLVVHRLFTGWKRDMALWAAVLPEKELLILMLVAVVFLWLAEFWSKKTKNTAGKTLIIGVTSIWLVLLALILTAGTDAVNSFIYFDF